eukprot:2376108-Rhodomonas_salina.1
MGNTALTILQQGFVIPRTHQQLVPCYERNHPTVNEDPALIHLIVAKYVLTCTVETVPRLFPAPSIIHALGLVPKKSVEEPWRIIHDCRTDNDTIVHWPSELHSVSASSYLFSRKCWVFYLDIKAAYLTVPLAGCGGGLRKTGLTLPDGSPEYIMGCSLRDGTCRCGCDKDRL